MIAKKMSEILSTACSTFGINCSKVKLFSLFIYASSDFSTFILNDSSFEIYLENARLYDKLRLLGIAYWGSIHTA
ncbi:hypothetical protein J6TS1_15660 [Siminovitchia terrae]|uniref:Uncharacterized protein n=1 Tax=Siminovitchia terrae TaxID=1914933 RepID=A0ABQ4KVQ5_SIMTE|nr:hypothetical protein J6TS1_15660 [Siminovitchia terrae]